MEIFLPADRVVSLVEAAALPVRLMSFPPCRETVFPSIMLFLCFHGMDFIVGGRGGTAEQTSFFMAVVFFQVCYFFSVFYRKVSSRFYGGRSFGTDICCFDGCVSFGLHGKAAFGGDGGAYIAGDAVMAVVIPVPCDGRVFF